MKEEIFCKLKSIFIPCRENKYKPGFLGGKFLFHYAIFLLLLKLIIVPFLISLPQTVFFADLTKINLIEFANTARQDFGIHSLRENAALNQAAYLKAKDMVEKGYFAHYSPDGVTPWYWLEKSGYNYLSAGENLAIGFLESEQVHSAWMNSLSHKKNILNPNYQEIGIAVVKGDFKGEETTFVVQFFGTQRMISLPEERPADPSFVQAEQELEIPAETEEEILESELEEGVEEELEEERLPSFVAVQSEEVISSFAGEKLEITTAFILFQFMTSHYYDFLQKIIYGSLVLVILFLLVTIYCDLFVYHKFEIQHKDIVFKAIGFSALWFVLIFLDKLIIVEMLARNFRIN